MRQLGGMVNGGLTAAPRRNAVGARINPDFTGHFAPIRVRTAARARMADPRRNLISVVRRLRGLTVSPVTAVKVRPDPLVTGQVDCRDIVRTCDFGTWLPCPRRADLATSQMAAFRSAGHRRPFRQHPLRRPPPSSRSSPRCHARICIHDTYIASASVDLLGEILGRRSGPNSSAASRIIRRSATWST